MEIERREQRVGRACAEQRLLAARQALGAALGERDALRGERRLDRRAAPLLFRARHF